MGRDSADLHRAAEPQGEADPSCTGKHAVRSHARPEEHVARREHSHDRRTATANVYSPPRSKLVDDAAYPLDAITPADADWPPAWEARRARGRSLAPEQQRRRECRRR